MLVACAVLAGLVAGLIVGFFVGTHRITTSTRLYEKLYDHGQARQMEAVAAIQFAAKTMEKYNEVKGKRGKSIITPDDIRQEMLEDQRRQREAANAEASPQRQNLRVTGIEIPRGA